jgi:hypothetical protein
MLIDGDGDGNEELTRAFHQRQRWQYHQLPRIPALDLDEVMRKNLLPPDDNWDHFGRAIGNNSHLKEMSLHDSDSSIPMKFLLYFFHGCALSRSIWLGPLQ